MSSTRCIARAAADRSIKLTLFSALTLEKPRPSSLLERRFIAPGDRSPVRRLSRPGLCRRAACRRVAAQHRGDRVLLPGRQMAARAVRAAALHLRELYPCLVLSAGARAERRHPAGRETRGRWRDALQPELQHRHHARHPARTERGPGVVQADRPGQFRAAVHAGRRRSAGGRIFRCARQPRDGLSAVRAAGRAGQRHQICDRASCGQPRARRRHLADRHRAGRRCAGAGADRSPPRQRAVPRHHAAACAGSDACGEPGRSRRGFTGSAKC